METSDSDVVMGVYRLLSQDGDTGVLFYKELKDICRSGILMEDFSFSDFDWDCDKTNVNKSGKLPKHVEDKFLIQVLREPTRKDSLLNLSYVNGDGLMGEIIIVGCLGHSHHEMLDFKSFDMRRNLIRVATMDFGRAGFQRLIRLRLLEKLVSKVPIEPVFEGSGVLVAF